MSRKNSSVSRSFSSRLSKSPRKSPQTISRTQEVLARADARRRLNVESILSNAQARDKVIRDIARNPSPSIKRELVNSIEKLVKSKSPTRSPKKLTKSDVDEILSNAQARGKVYQSLMKNPSPTMQKELLKSAEKLVNKNESVLFSGLGRTEKGLDLDKIITGAQIRTSMVPSLWRNYREEKTDKRSSSKKKRSLSKSRRS